MVLLSVAVRSGRQKTVAQSRLLRGGKCPRGPRWLFCWLKLCGLWEEAVFGALEAGCLLSVSCLASLGPADGL